MPIVLFNFARNLKITRFTIDVLTQRLEHLESPRDGSSEEWSRFVGLTHESVAARDQLHDALRLSLVLRGFNWNPRAAAGNAGETLPHQNLQQIAKMLS
jgi:hypothetical protein